ncbi:acyltransferase family protein [Paenibacillus sp. FA6]|uniref:acyltransferase family protein n=1 Tax=Paenibacillus sp. FA6 TaxID=3413029 RepID=UPI003F65A2AB
MNDNTKFFRNQHMGSKSPLQSIGGKRYMPGLDGLRALSVLAVIGYHLNLKWAQGGLLGVGIFFVISGYLITDQIINQWEQYRRLSLLDFWIRRARRLLPAMLGMLLFVVLWLLCVDHTRLFGLWGDFLSSLFYVNNWWLIFHKVSYFENFGPPSPIGHLWSLSIEGQFYIIWPLVLVIGIKIAPQRGKLIALILACATASALAMAMIYVPGTDPSRVYYGTDTRVFALLIGAALAVVWPSQKLHNAVFGTARHVLDIIGGLGLFILIVQIYQTNEFDDSLYRGGFLLLSFVTVAVIAVLVHPASRVGWIIGCKPLRWIGVRSYSLYIWHYPVIILTSPSVNTDGISVLRIILQLAASFLLAALSYKYVEEPLRRGSFRARRQNRITTRRRGIRPVFLIAIISLILIPIACSSYLSKNEPTPLVEVAGLQNVQHEQKETASQDGAEADHSAKEGDEIEKPSTPPVVHDTTNSEDKKPMSVDIQSGKGITAIGDSVILDAAPFLGEMLPGVVVDGKVGRQMWQVEEVVDRLKAQGRLGNRIIIQLGTNGAFNTKQLRKLLHSLSDAQQIVLVNTRVPRKWQDTVNANIAKVSGEFNNTMIVDWYSASEGKDDYFYRDGVHLKSEGAKYYASILAKAMEK